MPNWIEGTFRARGKKENIDRFLKNGVGTASWFDEKREMEICVQDYGDSLEYDYRYTGEFTGKSFESLHIKGTRRHFLENLEFGISVNENKSGEMQFATDFKAAWFIDDEQISDICKQYGIDIRINGYERGQEFEQIIEIDRNGTTLEDKTIEYDDWNWECAMPLLGG